MNKNDQLHVLPPTRIGMPPEIRLDVITLLNQTLACTMDLRSQVGQACWNIKGKDFSLLHPLFSTMLNELQAYTDMVAQRITVLGGVVMGTVRMAARQSKLPEYPDAVMEGDGHVQALAERFGRYAVTLRENITLVADVEDAGSAAIYTDISRRVDRQLWVLESHLHHREVNAKPEG
ncbi:MAG TPA: DNA starvation/stationary phase protection protein Dps [Methylomirabilota bacterium]|jgi:starvation-inducible DNA-binding protein|nr:DNA starvation/stationary phase protection protein Dps [Methylomirabilota bacterium]